MAYLKTPGLYKRGDVWHMDKVIFGQRICESTHARTLIEAERCVAHRIEEVRQAQIYGVRPERNFAEASEKFIKENQHKRSIQREVRELRLLAPYIAELPLQSVHMGSLQSFIDVRQAQGVKNRTINYALQVIRRILNLAATEWMDEHGLTWLSHAPKIRLLPLTDARPANPLNWEEQGRLFKQLPTHPERMALFAVNTGCREQEICALRWEWEYQLEHFNASIFVIPGSLVKNGDDRLVVLNKIAYGVIESVRGNHPEFVFTYKGRAVNSTNNIPAVINSSTREGKLSA